MKGIYSALCMQENVIEVTFHDGASMIFSQGTPMAVYIPRRGWFMRVSNEPKLVNPIRSLLPNETIKPVVAKKWEKFIESFQSRVDL